MDKVRGENEKGRNSAIIITKKYLKLNGLFFRQ